MQPSIGNQNNKDFVYMRSRQGINPKNHVSYFSNNLHSERDKKEINQKISRNNQQKKELELDHPQPLITDYDEDIYELKTQFYTKTEKNNINTNQKLKDLPQENQDKNTKNEIYSEMKNISNENINNINLNNKSKKDKEIKINNFNSENKAKGEIVKNNSRLNNNEQKNYSIKTFDRRNIPSNAGTNYENIEKISQTIGKLNKNEKNNKDHILIKSNSIIKNKNTNNKNNPRLKIYPSTACLNTSNINKNKVVRKLVYQESDKNNLINQQPYKYNTNKINTNYPKSNINMNIKNISQYINTHNKQILHKIKEENSSNKENIINNNKLNANKNPFISFDNFNNTKTTVVVFSKFKKIKPVLKANIIPNCSQKNNNKNRIGQNSSMNIILNNTKNSYYEPYSYREEKINNKRKIGIKKNQNIKLLFLDRSNYEINYKNFIKSSKTENNKSSNDEISIKTSTNKKQKIIIPNYNNNYDYNYYYGNNTYAYNRNSITINYNSPYVCNYNY